MATVRFAVFAFAGCLAASVPQPAQAAGTLTVAMTAADLPIDTGQPDQGFEGFRFVGYNLYDSLSLWDLSHFDKPSDIKPGLATEFHTTRRTRCAGSTRCARA